MQRRLTAIAVAVAALVAAPLAAATVYVPALDSAARPDGSHNDTELWVSNSGALPLWLTAGRAGVTVDGASRVLVPAGRSIDIRGLARPGADDLLAFALPDSDIDVEAQLLTRGAGTASAARLPVITAADALTAGTPVLLGASTHAGAVLDGLGVVNLGAQAAQCEATLVAGDGSPVGGPVSVAVAARAMTYRRDLLARAGAAGAEGLRATVRCDQPFYAFTALRGAADGAYQFLTPSRGATSGDGIACTNGTICYDFPGVDLVASTQTPTRAILLDPPDGSYRRVTVHLEVEIHGWTPPLNGAHGILYMIRDKNRDMFANVFLQGPAPNGNALVLRHGFNQTHPEKAKFRVKFSPKDGQTYAFDYVYDTGARMLALTVTGPNGQRLLQISDKPNIDSIDIAPGQLIHIGLSNPGTTYNEPTSTGWIYENLHVELTPAPP